MKFRTAWALAITLFTCVFVGNVAAEGVSSSLDAGFRQLYNLDFASAQREFARYQQQRPDDPLGPTFEGAGVLFQELDRLGVLEAQFFVKDSSFKGHPKASPDPQLRAQFEQALTRAETLARKRVLLQPKDRNALFALTMVSGLRADYTALIEKRNVAALHFTRDATESAHALLAECPDCYDAYVATGISEYLIGSVALPFRWVLRLGGYAGDKQQGITQLQLAAEHGHYLAPFARILLAIAYLRENQPELSRVQLEWLRDRYPGNALFARELGRLPPPKTARARGLGSEAH